MKKTILSVPLLLSLTHCVNAVSTDGEGEAVPGYRNPQSIGKDADGNVCKGSIAVLIHFESAPPPKVKINFITESGRNLTVDECSFSSVYGDVLEVRRIGNDLQASFDADGYVAEKFFMVAQTLSDCETLSDLQTYVDEVDWGIFGDEEVACGQYIREYDATDILQP